MQSGFIFLGMRNHDMKCNNDLVANKKQLSPRPVVKINPAYLDVDGIYHFKTR